MRRNLEACLVAESAVWLIVHDADALCTMPTHFCPDRDVVDGPRPGLLFCGRSSCGCAVDIHITAPAGWPHPASQLTVGSIIIARGKGHAMTSPPCVTGWEGRQGKCTLAAHQLGFVGNWSCTKWDSYSTSQ